METKASIASGSAFVPGWPNLGALLLLGEPVALLCWAVAALAWLALRRSSARAPAIVALLAVYTLFTTPFGANALISPLEKKAVQEAAKCTKTSTDAIVVVLAGGSSPGAHDATDVQYLRESSYRRLFFGLKIARSVPGARLLLSGGSGGWVKEADMLATLSAYGGLDAGRLLIDRQSLNTTESAQSVARLIAGVRSPLILVTSASHVPRALAEFRAVGLDPCPAPTDFQFVRAGWPGYIIPQLSAVTKATLAMHEYLGLLGFEFRTLWLSLRH